MDFDWDETKRAINIRKHGLDFADVIRIDWTAATIMEDIRFSYPEGRRFWAFGRIDGRLHMVAFGRPAPNQIRIISFRKANRKEAKRYG